MDRVDQTCVVPPETLGKRLCKNNLPILFSCCWVAKLTDADERRRT